LCSGMEIRELNMVRSMMVCLYQIIMFMFMYASDVPRPCWKMLTDQFVLAVYHC
jgi:hypothetical protein